ncbi:hypothetical protein NE237_022312 [Protea cynaroides]|uniref:NAC domain-containing protein n=1 Tax=Protea cynaroides TaxID=273540 RepID=A0A9Q0K5P7_9MAGN|nr:hypothetical protein NE237_022312 [Protea cynaroides]
MGEPNPKKLRSIPISFAPGFRFHPTEEQLLCYYLSNKNNCERHDRDLSFPYFDDNNIVQEIDLYGYDPCDLPDIACFPYGRGGSRKHWYCFTAKASTERVKRKARGGFWKRKGRARDIVAAKGGPVLGKRKTSVFYSGNSSRTRKTDWVLYEYTLIDNLKDSFALCRVFFKSHPGNKIAEHVPSSCTDKSIAAIHDTDASVPYKQHDGALGSGIGEVLVHADTSFGTDNEIQRLAQQPSDDGFQFPMTIPQSDQLEVLMQQQVESSNGIVSGSSRSTVFVVNLGTGVLAGELHFSKIYKHYLSSGSETSI